MSDSACLDQVAALFLAIVPSIVLILELELVLGFFKGPMRSSF